MFEMLRALFRRRKPVPVTVEIDDEGITLTRGATSQRITWHDLSLVAIMTTGVGPFGNDFFWILEGANKRLAVANTTAGAQDLLAALQDLPDFDNMAVLNASGSAEDRIFLCWRRQEDESDD
jgi:hypothetical protein